MDIQFIGNVFIIDWQYMNAIFAYEARNVLVSDFFGLF